MKKIFTILTLMLTVLSFNMQAAQPVSGWYRIKNARGLNGRCYVNVTSKFTARPNLTKEETFTAPGTIHYIGIGENIDATTWNVTRLSAQGRNANALAERGVSVIKAKACEYVDQLVAENPSYAIYSAMIKNIINTYDVNTSVNVRSTTTSTGEDAYYCIYTTPSMETFSNLVSTLFAMGQGQNFAAQHPEWFNFENGVAVSLNEIAFFASLKEMVKEEVVNLGYDVMYPDLYAKLIANIDRIKPATTYYLSQDEYATFDYIEEDDLDETDDVAKWIIEPVDEENYFAVAPSYYYIKGSKGLTYYYTTLYTDFAYTLPEGVTAIKVTGIEAKVNTLGNTYYVCNKTEITGQVPAYTPVVIETPSQLVDQNMLMPTGSPVDGPEADGDNLLVGSFFDGANEGAYREFATTPITIGFFGVAEAIKGNEAYLDANALTPSDAPVYYLYDDQNTQSAIDTVDASKGIANVKYVNLAGVESATPFNGVNIVVVTYIDGTRATMKLVK